MTNKELRRLSRTALIELLIEQTEINQSLEAKVERLEKQVKNKTIAVSTAGSMADAALELNNVFSSADKAAQQYLENIKDANKKSEEIIEAAKRQAAKILAEAQMQAGIPTAPQASAPEKKADSEQPGRRREALAKKAAGKPAANRRDGSAKPKGGDPLDDLLENAFSEMRRNNK